MLDTRAEVARLLNRFRSRSNRELLTFLLCAVAASAVAFLPAYPGLEEAGRWSLAIVAFGAGLWITEAIPSFAVALLVIGLQVAILGRPGGVLAVTVPNARYPYWYDPINRVAEGVFRRPIRRGPFAGIWANHQRLYRRDDLVGLVERGGFAVEVVEELTHYCFPATQTLVYTVGKPLVEHNLLPAFISRSTHRFSGAENSGSRLNPLNWMHAILDRFDRPNEDPARVAGKETFVNVTLKARRL